MSPDDEEEFRRFAAARMDDLRGLAYLSCGNWQTAEDAVSTALTKLYVNWKRITTPHPYVCRVVLNAVIDESRRPWRREQSAEIDALDRPEPDRTETYGEQLHLRAALLTLPPGQRAVLVLRFYADFGVDEVAEILRKSPGTVKSQTARGLAGLRKLLADPDAATMLDFKESDDDDRYAPAVPKR